jgi:hypothetical protein
MAKWHQLIKTGRFTDRHGNEHDITSEILDRVAGNYDSEKKAAHIIVGHPDKKTVPSFGVIEALKRAGDVLFFKPGNVVAEFASLVRQGAFPGVSAGFDHGFNNLNHVAFLSAQSPAVDGLEPMCEFSAFPGESDEHTVVDVDITEPVKLCLPEFASSRENWVVYRINDIGRLLRGFKNYLIEKESQEKADAIMSEWNLEELVSEPPTDTPEFSAVVKPDDQKNFEQEYNTMLPQFQAQTTQLAEFSSKVSGLAAENTSLKSKNETLQARIVVLEAGALQVEFSSFVESLVLQGKILPDQKQAEIGQLELLHKATSPEFSSANGEKSPLDKYKESLTARPVLTPPGEIIKPEFAASSFVEDPVLVGKRAMAYIDEMAAKGVRVSSVDAVEHVKGL